MTDFFAVTALLAVPPQGKSISDSLRDAGFCVANARRHEVIAFGSAAAFVSLAAFVFLLGPGWFPATADSVFVFRTADAGAAAGGEWKPVRVVVRNTTRRAVTLVGGTSTCTCIATDGLPAVIRPGGERAILVRLKFAGGRGFFARRFLFYTDDRQVPYVVGRLRGYVRA